MKFLNIVSLNDAKSLILAEKYRLLPSTMKKPIGDSLGNYTSKTVVSPIELPQFSRSTVDGYAVRVSDVSGASESIPSMLKICNEVKMGYEAMIPISRGETSYIPTGGMLPKNAEGVAMIEHTELLDVSTVLIQKPLAFGENVIHNGDDLKIGETLVCEGHRIRGLDIGLLAGAGISMIEIYTPFKVVVLSTGDEIVDCNDDAKLGEVYDINGYALRGNVEELGCEVVQQSIIKDDFDSLKFAIDNALSASDFIIVSGGSSVGTRDFTQAVIESFADGKLLFHGISIKPGKPTMVGAIGDKLIFCLPGHPTASALVFQELVKPYILKGYAHSKQTIEISARLTDNVHASPGKDNFIPVELIQNHGQYQAKPLLGKSGLFSIMAHASGYIHISSEKEGLLKDALVNVKLL
ncbi:molybdopterin molybdotransferase MoeA [Fusibacter bizertensis]